MLKTDYIILRKTPYQETSLIVNGLSPDFGRLDFLLKGACGTGAKKFPYAGLFRELTIEFRETAGNSSLFYMKSHEPKACYDAIANRPENYLKACDYARFLLKHTHSMLELPLTYRSLTVLLRRLAGPVDGTFPVASAKLVFLQESGFVPEAGAEDPKKAAALEAILEYALTEECPAPPFSEEYRKQLIQWTDALCIYHDLRI